MISLHNRGNCYFVAYILINTLIFNEGNASGGLVVNSKLIMLAIANISLLFLLVINERLLLGSRLRKYVLFLFLFFLLSSVVSFNLRGLYYSLHWLIVLYISSRLVFDRANPFNVLTLFVYTVFIAGFIRQIMTARVSPLVPMDRAVVVSMWLGMEFLRLGSKAKGSILLILTFLGRSFSGIISFFLVKIVNLKKRYVIILVPLVIYLGVSFVQFLQDNQGLELFYSKNAEHFLSGSGRVMVLTESIDYFLNVSSMTSLLVGHGYTNEREFLLMLDVPWVTDPHNELLRAIIQFGFMGLVLLLILYYLILKEISPRHRLLVWMFLVFSMFNAVIGFKANDVAIIVLFLTGREFYENRDNRLRMRS